MTQSPQKRKTLIIAEAGNNHEGNIGVAELLIVAAKEAGAHMVKFQAGIAAGFARKKEDIERYKRYELGNEGYMRLVEYGETIGIPVFFSVWSDGGPAEEWLSKYRLMPNFKIAARQCDQKLIDKHDREGVLVSVPHTWMTNLRIRHALPLHCVSEYPAKSPMIERFVRLKQFFSRPIGYSDHTVGTAAARALIQLGAIAVEKHFTLSHNFGPLRDHALSADPGEMKELVDFARRWDDETLDGI